MYKLIKKEEAMIGDFIYSDEYLKGSYAKIIGLDGSCWVVQNNGHFSDGVSVEKTNGDGRFAKERGWTYYRSCEDIEIF